MKECDEPGAGFLARASFETALPKMLRPQCSNLSMTPSRRGTTNHFLPSPYSQAFEYPISSFLCESIEIAISYG